MTGKTTPTRAAGYVRVSTGKQADEGLSLPEQERRVTAFVELRGWTLTDVYVEAGVTGRREDRPELEQLLRAAEAGRFDVVVIPKIDRFGRNFRHNAALKGRLEDAGVTLVAMDTGVDFSMGAGVLIWASLSAVAQMESENIGQRVADVAEARARAGKVYGGRRALYGYRRRRPGEDAPGIVPVPEQARIVRRVFEEAAAGVGVTEITYRLNEDDVRTAQGKEWNRQNVRRLLRAAEYRGAVAYKGRVVCDAGEHEPIVDRALWEEAQRTLAARAELPARGSGRAPIDGHLLRGILRCGACGRTMRSRTYPSGVGVYFCDRRAEHRDGCPGRGPYPRAAIDGQVLDYFNSVGLDMEATRKAFDATAQRRIAEARATREAAERDLAEAADDLQRVRRDYRRGAIDADEWHSFRDELDEELRGAKAALERAGAAEAEAIAGAELHDAEEAVLRRLADLRRRIVGPIRDAADVEVVRGALVKVFESFTLRDEDVMARLSDAGPRTHGWQADLFFAGPEGASCYLEPHVRAVAVEGIDVPDEHAGYAPAEAFPVLRRTRLDLGRDPALIVHRTA